MGGSNDEGKCIRRMHSRCPRGMSFALTKELLNVMGIYDYYCLGTLCMYVHHRQDNDDDKDDNNTKTQQRRYSTLCLSLIISNYVRTCCCKFRSASLAVHYTIFFFVFRRWRFNFLWSTVIDKTILCPCAHRFCAFHCYYRVRDANDWDEAIKAAFNCMCK